MVITTKNKKCILIVVDEEDIRLIFQRALTGAGYECFAASNVQTIPNGRVCILCELTNDNTWTSICSLVKWSLADTVHSGA